MKINRLSDGGIENVHMKSELKIPKKTKLWSENHAIYRQMEGQGESYPHPTLTPTPFHPNSLSGDVEMLPVKSIPWICYERSFSEFYLSIWNQLVFNQRLQLFVQ